MSSLQSMLDQQRRLQERFDPRAVSSDPQKTCEYLKDMSLATVAEVMELMEETGWKPWSTSWHVNQQAARGEWIDAWHFMMNLANRLQMDEQMIVEMYEVKAQINRDRIASGYDGVSTKCGRCKRALDDPGVGCYKSDNPETGTKENWCAMEENWF